MSLRGAEPSIPGVPNDEDEAQSVIARLAADGWSEQLIPGPDPATLRCGRCREVHPLGGWTIDDERRLEGASDPADMVLVVAATCRAAAPGHGRAAGPEASATDSDLVAELPPRSPGERAR
ncbi:MAG: hypothetical protein R2702_16070 [Acidimicrobiales bacterium]